MYVAFLHATTTRLSHKISGLYRGMCDDEMNRYLQICVEQFEYCPPLMSRYPKIRISRTGYFELLIIINVYTLADGLLKRQIGESGDYPDV